MCILYGLCYNPHKWCHRAISKLSHAMHLQSYHAQRYGVSREAHAICDDSGGMTLRFLLTYFLHVTIAHALRPVVVNIT